MTKDELLELHTEICTKAKETMVLKNHDYASGGDPFANFRASLVFSIEPEISILVRTIDKLKRIETFITDGKLLVKEESVDDAIEDSINYLILIAGLIRERKENV